MVHTYNKIVLSHKKEIIPFAATWMDLEIIILSKSDIERDKYHDIPYIWKLKHGTNEPVNETETDSQAWKAVVAKGQAGGGRTDWEFGVSRCKLLCIEWIDKVLLYSTGNYIQYS